MPTKKTKAQVRDELEKKTAEFLSRAQVTTVPMGEQRVYDNLKELGFQRKEVKTRLRIHTDKLINLKVKE